MLEKSATVTATTGADIYVYNVTSKDGKVIGNGGDVVINNFDPTMDKIVLVDSAGLLKNATSLADAFSASRDPKFTSINFESKVIPATAGGEDQTLTESITLSGVYIKATDVSAVLQFA